MFFVRVHVRGARARRTMEKLAAADPTWDFADYRRTVRHIFYTVQQAWMERDQDIARDCLSRSLYDQYHTKSEWMALRHEKNILRNIRLLEAMPVDVEDDAGEQNDRMWVYIHARMVDYTVDDRTMELKSGDRLPHGFVEYWKIIREDGRWVLDEIRQKDELNLNTL